MDRRLLFISTLGDIYWRSTAPESEYDVLMMAGPLRKLLVDGDPLMHQVNRQHRLRIEFEYHSMGPPPPPLPTPVLWSIQDGLDPETSPTRVNPVRTKLDAFLGQAILVVRGELYSVRDAIVQVSNVAGAVHAGSPKDAREALLGSVGRALQVGGLDPVTRSLGAIGRVTVRALTPLREAVLADAGPGASGQP